MPISELVPNRAAVVAAPAQSRSRWFPPPQSQGYQWVGMLPFIIVHILPLAAIWTGVHWYDWICCAVLYVTRMFFLTGAYHRYFSHRTFKTSRWFQFILAFFAMTSAQKGVLWWADHHRKHHKHADLEADPHSPVQRGFWYSHVFWIFDHTDQTEFANVSDLAKYPELRWLDKYYLVPPTILALAVWGILGWSGLWIGFMLSTVFLWHGTFLINSLAHVFGRRRFATKDDSRNSWILALLTLGEGWHNNHHHYMSSTRQGFYWWEVDFTYYGLKALSWIGLIWDLREPPASILASGKLAANQNQPTASSLITSETLEQELDGALP